MLFIKLILVCFLIFSFSLLWNAARRKAGSRKLSKENTVTKPEELLFYAERLSKMIQCKTVSYDDHYDDSEFAKLRETMRELFPLIHKTASKQIFGQDCWIYKIEGKDKKRHIMLMSHHDVVAAEGEWEYDPFAGCIHDGKLWGRGAVDTKTPLFAEFQAVEELLSDGFVPACNLYLGSSHNEEVGGDGIKLARDYFKSQGISFEWVLDEGGAVIAPPIGGMDCKCAMIAIHEKGRHTVKCIAKETSSHIGLSPKKQTPIVQMAKFITEINTNTKFIRRLHPEIQSMFSELCPYMPLSMRIVFSNLWCFGPILKVLLPKINPQAGAMLGTSCTFTGISGGTQGPEKSRNCSAKAFLQSINKEDFKKDFNKFCKTASDFDILIKEEVTEFHIPADRFKPGYAIVKQCVENIFPYAASAPFILPAGTDARHLTEICNCVIRFAPIDINPQQFGSVHGINENIDLKAIGEAVSFYRLLLKQYS